MRALTAAGEQVRTTGFPAVLDEAEDHYYVLEWSLTAAQRTLFLSQISADRHASDARIKYLTGASDVTRRGSFAPAQASSNARTSCLRSTWGSSRRSWCMADSHGGTARAATTTRTTDEPADVADRASAPPSPHLGTTGQRPETQRNAATFAERKAASDARLRSSRHREASRTGSAGTTARTPPTLTGPRGLPARAPRGCQTAPAAPAHPAIDGSGPVPAPTPPPTPPRSQPQGRGEGGAAPVGGRRDITLATTEGAGGGAACPGGDESSRSDYTSSGHGGGSYLPTTATVPADSGRAAATAGFPATGDAGTGSPWLDDVDFSSGAAPSTAAPGLDGPGPHSWGTQRALDALTAACAADAAVDQVYDSTDASVAAWHASLANLTATPRSTRGSEATQRSSHDYRGSSGPSRARGASQSCTTPVRRTASSAPPRRGARPPTLGSLGSAGPHIGLDCCGRGRAGLHLVLGDTFREVMSVSPMDMDVGDDLILGWDWISGHDLHHLHDAGRVCLRSGPATVQLPPSGPITRKLPLIGHGAFRRLLQQIELDRYPGATDLPPCADAASTAGGSTPRLDGVVTPAACGPRRVRSRRGRSTSGGPRSPSPGPTVGTRAARRRPLHRRVGEAQGRHGAAPRALLPDGRGAAPRGR